ncbi:hypothetical protein QBC41DRAFT_321303 [Cercophora samala]|uniref:Uncharacterized protein n=1 Tax=Cercophora samala TaxID=330535 RepID=A0AA39ZDW9_9PEZI|nr:hypothetical protein QBC41DRAFT_321303 [Cercophora samala]
MAKHKAKKTPAAPSNPAAGPSTGAGVARGSGSPGTGAGVSKVASSPVRTGSAAVAAAALKKLTKREEKQLGERIAGTINLQFGPLKENYGRPATDSEMRYRNIALFLPNSYWTGEDSRMDVNKRVQGALENTDAFRFVNLGDPEQRQWYADEKSGRVIEQMYSGWSTRFHTKLKETHQEIMAIVETLQETEEDSQKPIWKKLANLYGNHQALEKAQEELALTKEILEKYYAVHPFLDAKAESKVKRIERLQIDVRAKDTLIKKADEESDRYRVDFRLRMLLQHWGITNGDALDPSRWQKYDVENRFAAEFQEYLDDVLNGIPQASGNLLVQVRPPIGVKQLMRVASIHRTVHGIDLLADCRIVALRLVSARHDKANTDEVGILPKDLASRSQGENFSEVYVPPSTSGASVPPSTSGASVPPSTSGVSAVTTGMAQLTTTSRRASQLTPEQQKQRAQAIRLEGQFLVEPGARSEDCSWQALFDGTVLQLYNLDVIACEHILVALTSRKSLTPQQLLERRILQSHVDFINKWASIMEMVHHYAKKAQQRGPGSWSLWSEHWFRIRNKMTEQCFGAHSTLNTGDNPWSKRTKRGLFHDYVGLFGQTCKLFNMHGLQTAEVFKQELDRLDDERWNLYRYAIQTWTHGDARGGINDNGQYGGNPPKLKPRYPKKGNLWAEWNWIYETDKWKHAPRLDPTQPPGTPGLWDPLEPTAAHKSFRPFGPVQLAITTSERHHSKNKWRETYIKRHPPGWDLHKARLGDF